MSHERFIFFKTVKEADKMVLRLGKSMGILKADGKPKDPRTTGYARTHTRKKDGTALVKVCEDCPDIEGAVYYTTEQARKWSTE